MDKLLLSLLVSGGYLIGYLTRIIQTQARFRRDFPEYRKIIESILEEEKQNEQTVKR